MVEKLLSRKSLDIDDLSSITWTVALKMAEQEAWEEQEAFRRVEEGKAYADATMEIAIASRSRAQVLGENADLAVYKATMALKIAEAKKAAEPIELARNLFLN